jgi:hypothetical protein
MGEIDPKALAQHAEDLVLAAGADVTSPAGQINLRRAISAAYYALFHAITIAITDDLLTSSGEEERFAFRRALPHAGIKRVCTFIAALPTNSNTPGQKQRPGRRELRPIVDDVEGCPELVRMASRFLRLQELRHAADYDHSTTFVRRDALWAVTFARLGIEDLADAEATDLPRATEFFLLIAMTGNLDK